MPGKYKFIAVLLALLTVSGVALRLLVFTEARRVQNTMLALQEKISAPLDGGGLDLARYGAALRPLFASTVSVTVNHRDSAWLFERDDLLQAIVSVKRQNPALTVSFAFTRKEVIVSGGLATVTALVTARQLTVSEPLAPQTLIFTFQRDDGRAWRLATVANPPADHQQSSTESPQP
ncbi:MAG: hypothetical protein LBK71_00945 [Verrucomicrobiales bacterium]|jgi:hypothetical protein|nr:hypothetical protein [Verrucomicrobiales bacterium]